MKNKNLRTIAEVALLDQKTATELANVSDTINGTPVTGITKAQKDLYIAQKDGFARDAEQKLAKIMADTWSIQKSMNETMAPDIAGIAEYQMRDVINKARTGIGVSVAVLAPGIPTDVVAVAGDTEATVSFIAPLDNGGSVITSYTATSSPEGKTASGSVSPLTVTGLTNGTPYTFTVTATNIIGTSDSSVASNSVTPAA
jgi:hypothetical protein